MGFEPPGVSHLEVEANGLRFHVAECGEGDRLALCLHGFPELWLSWRHQLPLLSRLCFEPRADVESVLTRRSAANDRYEPKAVHLNRWL